MTALSIREAFADREILLTGASGFLGKVWLVMLLERVPEIRRIHLLLRPNGEGDSLRRFERIVNESPAFRPLHERHGASLAAFLRERVRVHAGDLTRVDLGLDVESFGGRLDLVVNCAAVVDFQPDVRDAFRTNILGAVHAAELARDCGAALVQVSTCFVAGRRDGRMPEAPITKLPSGGSPAPAKLPSGGLAEVPSGGSLGFAELPSDGGFGSFDPEMEYLALARAIEALERHHGSVEFERELEDAARVHLAARRGEPDESAVARQVERMRHSRIEKDWRNLGTRRADERGWPNTYTYTKSIAEGLLAARFPDVRRTVFRPSVVESARAFPFPGWNEGFNTCGPLAYLIGTWFKALPGRRDNPFDVVPVDMVCEGLTIAAAATLQGVAHPVYQCGTSDANRLTLGRANELTGLAQRRWLREGGTGFIERTIKSRADTTIYEDDHPLAVVHVEELMSRAADALRSLPERTPEAWRTRANKLAFDLDRSRRGLHRVEVMVDAFTPFTRDLRQVFACRNLASHDVAEQEFRWRPKDLDWRDYWLNVHMPGMRTWSFPLFEGKSPPRLETAHPVDLHPSAEAAE